MRWEQVSCSYHKKTMGLKQNEKEKEVTEINEGAISGIFESTSRDYIFIF